MKVYVSFDMEGVAGIVDWEQCIGSGPAYELGCRLTLDEVNAAIDGALQGGATEFLVNDSHGTMQNLPADGLHGQASYLSGRHKPLYMMEGLDGTFDAAFFVGYHGSVGTTSVLSHTYNPNAIGEVRLNGRVAGEAAINALVARHHAVPIMLITGDQMTADESAWLAPGAELVTVKESLTRFAARSLHPQESRRVIRDAAARAVRRAGRGGEGGTGEGGGASPSLEPPFVLEVDFLTADMAEMATWLRGVERAGSRTARVESDDALAAYRAFIAAVYLTRQAEGR